MLCYFFPPLGGGGVQRSTKFVKYLPATGWHPTVVTVEPNRRNVLEQGLDPSLLADVPANVRVIRCRAVEFSRVYGPLVRMKARWLLFQAERFIPLLHQDYKIGWYRTALRAAREQIRRERPEVVYTTSPPYSAHLLGARLKRELGLPWVADFRDPWTKMGTYRPATPWHAWLDHKLEADILREADVLIANTEENKRNLVQAFGTAPEKIHVILNGFDPEDFEAAAPEPDHTHFTVACLGKFYDMPAVDRFFLAYRRFADQHPEARLRLLGPRGRQVRLAAARILRPASWEGLDRIEHRGAVEVMRTAALLLLNLPTVQSFHAIPGKLFEYLAAGRPMLYVGHPEGETVTIVRSSPVGMVVPNEEAAILAALESAYATWRTGARVPALPADQLRRFNRRAQTEALAGLLAGAAAGAR